MNLLKGAVAAADMITAVSPTYAWEITTAEGGAGLDPVLRIRRDRLVGILNGIDREVWNPSLDPFLAARYDAADLTGKEACRRDLCRLAGFDDDDPSMILGSVGRLTDQKGFDLIVGAAGELVRRGVRIVLLGTGEPQIEHAVRALALHHPGGVASFVGYSEELAHKIEAGADAFVMPSRFEPCGLTDVLPRVRDAPDRPADRGPRRLRQGLRRPEDLGDATGFSSANPSAPRARGDRPLRAEPLLPPGVVAPAGEQGHGPGLLLGALLGPVRRGLPPRPRGPRAPVVVHRETAALTAAIRSSVSGPPSGIGTRLRNGGDGFGARFESARSVRTGRSSGA